MIWGFFGVDFGGVSGFCCGFFFLSGWFLGELGPFLFVWSFFGIYFFRPLLFDSIHTFPSRVLPSMVRQTLFFVKHNSYLSSNL